MRASSDVARLLVDGEVGAQGRHRIAPAVGDRAVQHDGVQQPPPPGQAGERLLAVGEQRGGLVAAARATVRDGVGPGEGAAVGRAPGRRRGCACAAAALPARSRRGPGPRRPGRAAAASTATPCSISRTPMSSSSAARGRSCSSRATTTRITCSRRGPLPPCDATSSARLRTSDGVAVPATKWAAASSISSIARALKARSRQAQGAGELDGGAGRRQCRGRPVDPPGVVGADVVDGGDLPEHAGVEGQLPRLQERSGVVGAQRAHHPELEQRGDAPRHQAVLARDLGGPAGEGLGDVEVGAPGQPSRDAERLAERGGGLGGPLGRCRAPGARRRPPRPGRSPPRRTRRRRSPGPRRTRRRRAGPASAGRPAGRRARRRPPRRPRPRR